MPTFCFQARLVSHLDLWSCSRCNVPCHACPGQAHACRPLYPTLGHSLTCVAPLAAFSAATWLNATPAVCQTLVVEAAAAAQQAERLCVASLDAVKAAASDTAEAAKAAAEAECKAKLSGAWEAGREAAEQAAQNMPPPSTPGGGQQLPAPAAPLEQPASDSPARSPQTVMSPRRPALRPMQPGMLLSRSRPAQKR